MPILSQQPALNASLPISEANVTNLTADLAGKTAKATLTTKGDLYAASAASTPARVAVGADATVLTADAASTAGVKWAPGGGSQPGAVYCADFLFTEPAGAHANLVATFVAPTGTTVFDMFVYPLAAPWAAATASFKAGDSVDAASYYDATDLSVNGVLKNEYTYSPDNSFTSLAALGNFYGAATPFASPTNGQAPGGGLVYPTGDTITMTVSGLASGGGGGQLLVRLWVKAASTPTDAA